MESQCGKILVVMTRGQSVVGCVTFINEIRVKYLVDIIRITITILYYFFPPGFLFFSLGFLFNYCNYGLH